MNSFGTKVLCLIDNNFVREALCFSESNHVESDKFNEEESISYYRDAGSESKVEFLSQVLKLNQVLENLTIPYSIDSFQPSVPSLLSLLSQIMGLDDDRFVIEVML